MSNKKIFSIIGQALTCLVLFSPIYSFSESNHYDKSLYVAGQYKSSLSHFTNFSVRETDINTKGLFKLGHGVTLVEEDIKNHLQFTIPHSVAFKNNFANFSAAVGYISPGGPRVEIEGSYENFDVKDLKNCTIQDACRYLSLAREICKENDKPTPKEKKYVVMRNDGISITSVTINGCYDFSINKLPKISPYICAGFGGDFIEFFDSVRVKFAYQSKLGINYSLSSNFILFVDGYYHRVIGNQFKNLNVQNMFDSNEPYVTSAIATLNIEHFGGGFGLRFIF
uniref:Omp-1-9 n=1 Tax=Ehrlichia ewingii TaxID=947 RepID=B1N6B2_9RICK|nr:Omp-1-9 [Ehrlichia ewingii]